MAPQLRTLTIAAVAAVATAASAAPASAATRVIANCDNGATSKPFTPWLDYANYFLVPGGDFEGAAAGWSLDGATVAAGSQAFGDGAQSLSLPAGASAESPAVCVGIKEPTSRFFLRRSAGAGYLRVQAVTETTTGREIALTVGTLGAGGSWAPSPALTSVVNLLPGTTSKLSLRLTAVGGSFQVDDVYVDPFGRS